MNIHHTHAHLSQPPRSATRIPRPWGLPHLTPDLRQLTFQYFTLLTTHKPLFREVPFLLQWGQISQPIHTCKTALAFSLGTSFFCVSLMTFMTVVP